MLFLTLGYLQGRASNILHVVTNRKIPPPKKKEIFQSKISGMGVENTPISRGPFQPLSEPEFGFLTLNISRTLTLQTGL